MVDFCRIWIYDFIENGIWITAWSACLQHSSQYEERVIFYSSLLICSNWRGKEFVIWPRNAREITYSVQRHGLKSVRLARISLILLSLFLLPLCVFFSGYSPIGVRLISLSVSVHLKHSSSSTLVNWNMLVAR